MPTWELRRQARLHDNEEVRTQLAMRQIIERKQQLNRQLTQFKEAREMAQTSQKLKLAYNDPETLRQLDREIAASSSEAGKGSLKKSEEMLSAEPRDKSLQHQVSQTLEVQRDELTSVKGQHQTQVWDQKRQRYTSKEALAARIAAARAKGSKKGSDEGEKNHYLIWKRKTNQSVSEQGAADEVGDAAAISQLKVQGLGRVQKRIILEREAKRMGVSAASRTTAADKFQLEKQLKDAAPKHKAPTKSQIVEAKARELRKQGIDWQALKRQNRARREMQARGKTERLELRFGNPARGKSARKGGKK